MEYVFTYESCVLLKSNKPKKTITDLLQSGKYDQIEDCTYFKHTEIAELLEHLTSRQVLNSDIDLLDKPPPKGWWSGKIVTGQKIQNRTTQISNELTHINLTELEEHKALRKKFDLACVRYLDFSKATGIKLTFPYIQYLGLKEEDAVELAKQNDQYVEITERDSTYYAIQAYYSNGRLTMSISNGIVTSCQVG